MREALSLHHVRFDSHERLECFSVHDYRKKIMAEFSMGNNQIYYEQIEKFTDYVR